VCPATTRTHARGSTPTPPRHNTRTRRAVLTNTRHASRPTSRRST